MKLLEAYRQHVKERAELGIVPKPLDAEQTAALVELLKAPPEGEEDFLLDLLSNRIPAGVDQAAYVKAGFLAAVVTGDTVCPLVDREAAIRLLGTMLGGYNIQPLIDALDDSELAAAAESALSHTLLMFDAFFDVKDKSDNGNKHALKVLQSWAEGDWFTNRDAVAEKITVTIYKVPGETNTDDLSPAPDAWSRPDIPLHALAMLKMPRENFTDKPIAIIDELKKKRLSGRLCR